MDSLFALVLGGLWLWVVYSGLRHVTRKMGGLFSGRSRESRDTWTDEEFRKYNVLGGEKQPEPDSIDSLTEDMEESLTAQELLADNLRGTIDREREALARLEKCAAEWADRAALALSKERQDLARAAIVERLETKDHIAALQQQLDTDRALLAGYEADIEKLHQKLAEAYRRQHRAYARIERAGQAERTNRLLGEEKVGQFSHELERLERIADEAEGRAEAHALGDRRSLADPFAALEAGDRIDRELARLSQAHAIGDAAQEQRRAG